MELVINSENPHKVEGEVLVRGDGVMRGYYKNLQATDNIFTDDGWMRTGDIGIVDSQGNVFLRGRSKNMILGASGQNIYPEEIEDKLNSLDGVAESVVVDRNGKLVALVYPDMEEAKSLGLTADDLKNIMEQNRNGLNQMLPAYEKITEMEIREEEFEKTPKRSIKRYLYN
jgi:long-chain acyl-CoA synthetase